MPTLRRGQASAKGIAWFASGQDPRVDGKLRPHAPYPGLVGVVADEPLPAGGRAGHHVEVVHVMARRGNDRAVPAVGHEDGIACTNLDEHVDGPIRIRRGRLVVAEAGRTGRRIGDLVVVDLLELPLRRRVLVVLCLLYT